MVGCEAFRAADCALDAGISECWTKLDGALDVCIEHRIVELVEAEIEVARNGVE